MHSAADVQSAKASASESECVCVRAAQEAAPVDGPPTIRISRACQNAAETLNPRAQPRPRPERALSPPPHAHAFAVSRATAARRGWGGVGCVGDTGRAKACSCSRGTASNPHTSLASFENTQRSCCGRTAIRPTGRPSLASPAQA
jgi:hypothetical protein